MPFYLFLVRILFSGRQLTRCILNLLLLTAPPIAAKPAVERPAAAGAHAAAPVFISLRFGEGMVEGQALQAQLALRGVAAFLCDVPAGEDIGHHVVDALSSCKLAVILGTATFGSKSECNFSTYEELRYIINEKKPFFLVKMCDTFTQQETRFHLPSQVSHFAWQPRASERSCVPSNLVGQIVQRLASVQEEGEVILSTAALDRPRTATTDSGGAATAAASHGPTASASNTATNDIAEWLTRLSLADFHPVLQAAGAETLADVHFAVDEGFLCAKDLESHGLSRLRVARFLKEASKVKTAVGLC